MSSSTLLNNYSTIYLINSKNLLKFRTFKKVYLNKIVEYKTFFLLIIGYSTWIIKSIFNRLFFNLTLLNIGVVEGFYINIILEACLLIVDI